MSVGLTKSNFWAIRIPNISDRYPNAFQCAAFLVCPSICFNTSFPILNFFFIHTWKSKFAKLINTIIRWVVGIQFHIAILNRVSRGEMR